MADSQRIEDLRRRVQKDPASIAFAQLAEELRRAGGYDEAVQVCRAGLELHPGYLSARVTLGRALIELNDLETALAELEHVLKSAPENLAAIRGLAEIHHRQGSLAPALAQYRAALALARNDPELQQTVDELARQVEPPPPPASADGLSFEQMQNEFLQNLSPPPPVPVKPMATPPTPAVDLVAAADPVLVGHTGPPPQVQFDPAPQEVGPVPAAEPEPEAPIEPAATAASWWTPPSAEPSVELAAPALAEPVEIGDTVEDTSERDHALQQIAVLEQFLDAIHVSRAQPRP